jgi:arginine-tRNA-protein transferase
MMVMMNAADPSQACETVDAFLEAESLPASPDFECPYLPEKQARIEGFQIDSLDPQMYLGFMDRGFRRSGQLIHRPVCDRCQKCQPIRVPVRRFRATKSQRRILRRNRDLAVTIDEPTLTDEKWRIFVAYLDHQHDQTMSRTRDALADFLYKSPVDTLEICYRAGDQIVAVSILDRCTTALSSVYVYFDPRHARRGPGTYSALWEIEHCRRRGIPYYYLGYYVADCTKMDYKARFRPCEILDESYHWVPFAPTDSE